MFWRIYCRHTYWTLGVNGTSSQPQQSYDDYWHWPLRCGSGIPLSIAHKRRDEIWEAEQAQTQVYRFIEVLQTISDVGDVVYELALASAFSIIHPIFHVFMLHQYILDEFNVLQLDLISYKKKE